MALSAVYLAVIFSAIRNLSRDLGPRSTPIRSILRLLLAPSAVICRCCSVCIRAMLRPALLRNTACLGQWMCHSGQLTNRYVAGFRYGYACPSPDTPGARCFFVSSKSSEQNLCCRNYNRIFRFETQFQEQI